ncbi:sodium:proton antiporter [Tersicoccus sp. Bi-70]|uniref:cation:proton antiporter n=1 Tax=Tersicoccus sp. Bi-70 TaxID=1897634 RepID=UPI0009764CE4|nr:cation:proton antiporter [Tersicoccus sp. Bi-70]OMH36945.1 cation:proton antiporter [Tersicoccus sp. Bi-70]
MTAALLLAAAVVVIVAVQGWARRTGVAAPLLLVAIGVAVSFLPFVPAIVIEPEWILAGVLPPLLYSSAVSMPTMDFRRDFGSISSLSVLLVVVTSVALGFVFHALLGVDLAFGIALGAVVSPTDAVATGIVKRLNAPRRVVTVLEGESLLNDASALVLLRSAIAATGGAVSLWGVAGDFVYAVLVAVAIGVVVGLLNLRVRAATRDAAASTAISFIAPFVASVPAEHLGASGLVAAVTAGLITGQGSARYLKAADRIAERSNWATVDLVLEGGIFLGMGLELFGLVEEVIAEDESLWLALGTGALAVALALVIRSLYVVPLLWLVRKQAADPVETRERLARAQQRFDASGFDREDPRVQRRVATWTQRMGHRLADIDYLARTPLGRREGALLVWAGMRGAITLAAAQTLPEDTPQRSLLVLIAFVAAAGSLLVQGGTLGIVVRAIGLEGDGGVDPDEQRTVATAMGRAAVQVLEDPGLRRPDGSVYDEKVVERARALMRKVAAEKQRAVDEDEEEAGPGGRPAARQTTELRLRIIEAQRAVLLDARAAGTVSSATLSAALDQLDADQISTELRAGGPSDG